MTLEDAVKRVEGLREEILFDDEPKIDDGLCGSAELEVLTALSLLEQAALRLKQAELFQATALGA